MPAPTSTDETPGWRWAARLSLAVAALIPLVRLPLAWQYVSPLPAWDQWSFVPVWDAYGSGRPVLPLLLEPYNGHANAGAKIVFFGLGLATRWSMLAECVASGLAAVLTLAVILRMLAESERRLLVLAAPVSAFVFSLSQFENFVTGYCLGQMLAQLAATLSLYLVTRRASWPSWLGAVACAALASLSHGVALGIWPAGLLALLLGPREGAKALRVAGWMLGSLGAALLLWALAGSVGGVRPEPAKVLPMLVSLVGSPLAVRVVGSTTVTIALGAMSLAAFIGVAAATRRKLPETSSVRWLAFGVMGLASATLVALGRSYSGLQQSLASHYITSTYPIALATLVLATEAWLLPLARRPEPRRRAAAGVLIGGLSLLVLLHTEAASRSGLRYLRHFWPLIQAHNAAILAGTATDAEIAETHHGDPALVRRGVAVLRREGLAGFAGPAGPSAIR